MAGFIGPVLPPNLKTNVSTEEQEPTEQKEALPEDSPTARDTFGPSLPVAVYGPALPLHLAQSSSLKPPSPPPDAESEDDEVVGPMPAGEEEREQVERKRKRLKIEKYSQDMKERLSGKNDQESKQERESWMTELPTVKKSFGLGPRKFRETAVEPGDQSVWTDTPADRKRKAQHPQKEKKKTESETDAVEEARNKEMRRRMEEYNREHRSESLVEIHRKKRAAVAVVGSTEERKPFNRETDLEISRTIATGKTKALLKDSASLLASKFTPSKQSFL